jgi:pimeloyl-ACP methyl ester carboxylesterase
MTATPTPGRGRPTTVLVHSPLTGAVAWGGLPAVLRDRGHDVVVLDIRDDDVPPYASRFVARAALQVRAAAGDARVVLVGHSGAGYLLPLIGAARRAARTAVAGYVFLDAGLPPVRPTSRLDLLGLEAPDAADGVDALLAGGGAFPDWTDDDLRDLVPDDGDRAALVASLRPRGSDFFTEPLPVAPDWPDAPCGYLQLSEAYDGPARTARQRGWPVVESPADRRGGHFAALVDPNGVADDLDALLALM